MYRRLGDDTLPYISWYSYLSLVLLINPITQNIPLLYKILQRVALIYPNISLIETVVISIFVGLETSSFISNLLVLR